MEPFFLMMIPLGMVITFALGLVIGLNVGARAERKRRQPVRPK